MPRKLKTEAIVLKKRALPGRDNIITLFTKEEGRLQTLAKGVKTITSKRLPHLQTANLIHVLLARTKDRFYLQETTLISGFSGIKKSSEKLSFVYFVFFVLDRLLPEDQKEPEIYNETKRFLIELATFPQFSFEKLEEFLNSVLTQFGYIQDKKTLGELKLIIEELINEKLPFFVI